MEYNKDIRGKVCKSLLLLTQMHHHSSLYVWKRSYKKDTPLEPGNSNAQASQTCADKLHISIVVMPLCSPVVVRGDGHKPFSVN